MTDKIAKVAGTFDTLAGLTLFLGFGSAAILLLAGLFGGGGGNAVILSIFIAVLARIEWAWLSLAAMATRRIGGREGI